MPKKRDRPETISIAEAADQLGVDRRVAKRAAETGQIPAIPVGSRLRVLKGPFEKLLRERDTKTKPDGGRP
jgi:excisionase family DNA binding protein